MIIGFTGTHKGMTDEQYIAVQQLVQDFFDPEYTHEYHHGDCVGADAQFDGICKHYDNAFAYIHPPENAKARAFCSGYEFPKKPYLVRNHDIVDSVDVMIATPGTMHEVLRSGTWATVRYTRKCKKQLIVVYPNGLKGE